MHDFFVVHIIVHNFTQLYTTDLQCNAFEPETCFCRDDKRKVILKGVYISMDLLHMDIHPRVYEFMHLSLSKVSQKHFKHAFPL